MDIKDLKKVGVNKADDISIKEYKDKKKKIKLEEIKREHGKK